MQNGNEYFQVKNHTYPKHTWKSVKCLIQQGHASPNYTEILACSSLSSTKQNKIKKEKQCILASMWKRSEPLFTSDRDSKLVTIVRDYRKKYGTSSNVLNGSSIWLIYCTIGYKTRRKASSLQWDHASMHPCSLQLCPQ